MLPDRVGVNRLLVHVDNHAELVPQTRPVEHRPAAQDAVSGPGGGLNGDARQDIDRVAHEDHDRVGTEPIELLDDGGDDALIGAHEAQTALAAGRDLSASSLPRRWRYTRGS